MMMYWEDTEECSNNPDKTFLKEVKPNTDEYKILCA